MDKVATKLLLSESCKDMNEEQKKRVSLFCEGKNFDEISEKIPSLVTLIMESAGSTPVEDKDGKGKDKPGVILENANIDQKPIEDQPIEDKRTAEEKEFAIADNFMNAMG
jgi:hypothetical protein